MMKCKVAIDDKNECTNCCYFCDKKDTCNDVCQDTAKVCEEQIEETDLQVIESTVPDVLQAITDITVQKKKLEEQEKVMKQKLLQAMEEHGVKSFENAKVKFMYVAPTTRTTDYILCHLLSWRLRTTSKSSCRGESQCRKYP